jgi:hypothetical protein
VKSQVKSVPAPVGGVNARDALAAMPPTDAISMDNWFPNPSFVAIRNGCLAWASGLPSYVETVMAYNGLPTRKLFGVSNGAIYDITVSGAVGAALVSSLANSRLQHAMFNAGGGNVLIWVNGGNQPQFYNGTSWANTTISGSGLTASKLITITVFKQRCWYIEQDTMNVWYSGATAFQGVLTVLPLGAIFKMGGTLMQMATWTIDNVSGIDDYAAFITTEGEVAIYQGYDPTQLSTWSLVGIFRIGRPIGRRCYTRIGADIFVITADGLSPLSKAMLTDRSQEDSNLTYKILNAINSDVQTYNANFGWQVIEYPLGNKLFLNVPEITDTTSHQWVMNSVTKSWCKFKGWNAVCWEIQQDSLYFGGNTIVYLADTGTSDAGTAITVDCKPAFSYFDVQSIKRFVMARPIFVTNANILPSILLNVDFQDIQSTPSFTFAGTAPWNTSPWNTTPWGGTAPANVVRNWQGIQGLGYVASGRISMQVKGIACQWNSTDYMFEPGGPI